VTFLNLFISVRRSTCFRRFFRPSSVAQNSTYSVRYRSDKYLTLYVLFWATDDGRKTRLKHVERLTEIYKLRNVTSCWLYSANILAMYGTMNIKFNQLLCLLYYIKPPLQFRFCVMRWYILRQFATVCHYCYYRLTHPGHVMPYIEIISSVTSPLPLPTPSQPLPPQNHGDLP